MFVVGWGRVYLDFWWELGMVGKTRPYRIIGIFDCFGKILVRGDRLLGKFGLGAIDFWENFGFGRSNVCRWVGAGLSRLLVGFGDGW